MSTTAKQDREFVESVISTSLLEESIDWIKSNLSPEEVYGEKELLEWARNFDPEDVFKEDSLASWAESNGYTKE